MRRGHEITLVFEHECSRTRINERRGVANYPAVAEFLYILYAYMKYHLRNCLGLEEPVLRRFQFYGSRDLFAKDIMRIILSAS